MIKLSRWRFVRILALLSILHGWNTSAIFAGCDVRVFYQADVYDQCGCTDDNCDGPTKDVRNSRWYCESAPPTVNGQEDCQTTPQIVGTRYTCYMARDYYMTVACLGTQAGCTAGLIACSPLCVAPPYLQCYYCLMGYSACETALLAGCSQACTIDKCYVDDDSARDLVRDVFDRFNGPNCTGQE
mgnify:CR=1 FL=1